MLNLNAARKPRRQATSSKKLALEAVEARNLMAADVMSVGDTMEATPPAHLDSDQVMVGEQQVSDGQEAALKSKSNAISNGFLRQRFGLPELRAVSHLDVWEHAFAIGSSGLDGVRAEGAGPTAEIGSSGLDGVDEFFGALGGGQEGEENNASAIPDKYLGVLRWSDLMEYFDVLVELEEIAREMDLDLGGESGISDSLARAQQDLGHRDSDYLTPLEFNEVIDRVIADVGTADASESTADTDDSNSKFESRIGEALQIMKERMVVYWQNVDGPGHVVWDPFGVADDR